MSIERRQITVSGVRVQVLRKDIKNLHLGVYPPHGRVRVATPLQVSDDAVRLAVIGKLGWIKRQQAKFVAQPRQSQREMVSGESHYFLGRRYRLRVAQCEGSPTVAVRSRFIELQVRPGHGTAQREAVLEGWYRQQLKLLIPPLIEKWQSILGVVLAEWGVKKMKTRWGTCNAEARRIWLNLELAKNPAQCLEYIVVHELAHLITRHHDERFVATLDKHLPQWQAHRAALNAMPLSHSDWRY
jgi:predicted metal-dependent hydrolase